MKHALANVILACLAGLMVSGVRAADPGKARLDDSWTLVVGTGDLERTAAEDLKGLLAEHEGVTVQGPVTAEEFVRSGGVAPAIVIGTAADNRLIADQKDLPLVLNSQEPESYHTLFRDGRLYIVGQSPKGAMNGVYRFDDRRVVDVAGYDVHESPAFHFRVGGHKMNQTPPPDWSEIDQARYYARHYINVVWGEKKGAPMSYEARRKYGLGLMVEHRFPPVDEAWRNDPANASAVYRLSEMKDWKVVDPFDPKGRLAYQQGFEELLKENPDIRIFYGVFGDYNAIPDPNSFRVSDNSPYRHSKEETMKQILGIMKEVCGKRDIIQVGWMWHAFFGRDKEEIAFMEELGRLGYGALYNEAGNADCWIIKRDNFNPTSLRTGSDGKTAYGPSYLPLVSAGGACESINPVIGISLPNVAETKIRRLTDIGVHQFAIWWAGYEGWVYQPNNEVVSEMIWNPQAFDAGNKNPFDPVAGDPLLRHVAERDFGKDLAPEILEFWRLFDHAIVTDVPLYQKTQTLPPPNTDGLHIYDWYQRMGIFTEAVFGGPYPLPLTPSDVAARVEVRKAKDKGWMKDPHAHANYAAVLENLELAVNKIAQINQRPLPPDVARRVASMYRWTDLYRRLLITQYHFAQAVNVMFTHSSEPVDSPAIRQPMTLIVLDEIRNDQALIQVISAQDPMRGGFAPNFNIRQNMSGVWQGQGSIADETEVLRQKIAAMQLWMAPRTNLARGCAAKASSVEMPGKPVAAAFDGDGESRWSSQYTDDQWIYVDLGRVQDIAIVQLHWNPAYAQQYEIRVCADAGEPQNWTTIYQSDRGTGHVETIVLPKAVPARYVMMKGIKRGTSWGYSLNEFEVYGGSATASTSGR